MSLLESLHEIATLLASTLRSGFAKARRLRATAASAPELLRDGIAIVPGFLPADDCERIAAEIREFAAGFRETTTLENGVRLHFRGVETGPRRYRDVGPIDRGMIDVFDIDRQLPALDSIKRDPRIAGMIREASGTPVVATSLHAYINDSVTATRGYHMDSGALQFKAFVALSDVDENADGPYSYVRGSHRFSARTLLHILRNFAEGLHLTEMSDPDPSRVVHALGPKGTLIVSDQNGWHRGLPQKEGRRRILLSINFAASA